MALTLREYGYESSKADPDVFIKPKTKPEYVLVYVDDILCISREPKAFMNYIATKYTLKAGSVKEPDSYFEAEITRATMPLSQGYRAEMDVTPELEAKRATYYQGQIGILRWMCELGQIDILVDVPMLARFLAAPRRGHLDEVFHVYAYLKSHDKTSMAFDDTMPYFDESRFQKCDWADYYPGAA